MHTQNRPISKKFLIPLHLFEMGNDSWGGVFEKFLKNIKKQKAPLNSSNREEKVIEKLLSCKLYNINFPKLKIY